MPEHMQPESRFKSRLVRSFRTAFPVHGWYTYIVQSGAQKRGMPDLLFVREDVRQSLWLEAKMEGNDLSPRQARTITRLRHGGQRVLVVTALSTKSGDETFPFDCRVSANADVEASDRAVRYSRAVRYNSRDALFWHNLWDYAFSTP